MTTILAITQTKGGVGASTFRVATAVYAAQQGLRVALVGDDDAPAIFGMAGELDEHTPMATINGVTLLLDSSVGVWDNFDLVITTRPVPQRGADHHVLVTKPCYLALRHAVREENRAATNSADGVVLIEEPGRSLGVRDVESVLGLHVLATVPVKASIARAVDAGVLPIRMPECLVRAAKQVLSSVGVVTEPFVRARIVVDPETGIASPVRVDQ